MRNKIVKFVKNQLLKFQDAKYNPYEFEDYLLELRELGFVPNASEFLERHPELETDEDLLLNAINAEQDINVLGNFILAYGRNQARGAWSMADIEYKKHIDFLKALLKLCK